MPTLSDYLTVAGPNGVEQILTSQFVRFHNNMTAVDYVSSAATDATGKYTITVPSGIYTLFYGPSSGSTPTATGDGFYFVGADVTADIIVFATGASHNFEADNDSSGQFTSAQLRLRHTSGALPNAGHEQWMVFTDRPAAGGAASNSRLTISRANPGLTIRQDYVLVETNGVFHLEDSAVFATGSPNPGLGGVSLGKTVFALPGAAPTLGALQTNIASQSLGAGSNDQRGFITLTTGATPPGAGATIALLNFGGTWTNLGNGLANPIAVVGDSTGAGANGTNIWSAQATTTVMTLFAGAALTANKTYTISYRVDG